MKFARGRDKTGPANPRTYFGMREGIRGPSFTLSPTSYVQGCYPLTNGKVFAVQKNLSMVLFQI